MFDDFWNLYPRKVAKKNAKKAWEKMNKENREKAIKKLPDHLKEWEGAEMEFIPHAATWLNAERWEDELCSKETTRDHILRAIR